MGAVAFGKTECPGTVDGDDKVGAEQSIGIEDLFADKGLAHAGDDVLGLVGVEIREGRVEGITVREAPETKQGAELLKRWAVAQKQTNLASGLEPAQKHHHPRKEEARKGIGDLVGAARIS